MLELTGDDVALLNDSDLRVLVARLCEAELTSKGLPTSAVTAGGDQNAADGGLDVRMSLDACETNLDFIPRGHCGFQVKKPDMQPADIAKEMRPKGVVRPVLGELAEKSGAYVIVSANGSTSDSALKRRQTAMRDALEGESYAGALLTDFYDRSRLATWVRKYPGLVAWVRARIGRVVDGWQPYESWSAPSAAAVDYLLDDNVRVFDSRDVREDGLSPLDGISRIRSALSRNGTVSRLIGLSGVGKTRLLEALFDDRVGADALDRSLALYCDLANDPDPSPREMLRHLIHTGKRVILIVDNCPPDTHHALASLATGADSEVSLITVEYDVRDDEPEATQVFRLEPASQDLIERLVERRAPHVSDVDRRRIAEFSEGNARVALALSNTVRRGETLGVLSDENLFDRLFHQREQTDKALLRAAEACSLVYSFDGETTEGDGAELPHLATLAGQSVEDLYRNIAELERRDLVQRRSRWRAVLPHALANKLATHALKNALLTSIQSVFLDKAPSRLLVSFSRRLGFLHDSAEAKKVVSEWLAEGGLLNDLENLTDPRPRILSNVAPVAPEIVLSAMEKSAAKGDEHSIVHSRSIERSRFIGLAHALAYEPLLFPRAVALLGKFVLAEKPDQRMDSARSAFEGLFHIYLSGTKALLPARLAVAREMATSDDAATSALGMSAFEELLKADQFSSTHEFSFGARPRDYGWHPQFNHEIRAWYKTVLTSLSELHGLPRLREQIRETVASTFKELWRGSGAWDELDGLVRKLAAEGDWSKGWIAVRTALRLEGMPEKVLVKLKALEELLRPKDLLQTARTYLLATAWSDLDDVDEEDDEASGVVSRYERANERAIQLGKEIAEHPKLVDALLPEATSRAAQRAWLVGKGLALGAPDLDSMWRKAVQAFSERDPKDRNDQALSGFICGASERDKAFVEELLDEAVDHPILGAHYPRFQIFAEMSAAGLARVRKSLSVGRAEAWVYSNLAGGRVTDGVASKDLAELILEIADLKDGYAVAINLLGMRQFSSKQKDGPPFDEPLIAAGRALLAKCTFNEINAHATHQMSDIARECLAGSDGEEPARALCRQIVQALDDYRSSAHSYDELVSMIFEVQPKVALDELLAAPEGRSERTLMRRFAYSRREPISRAPRPSIIEWAKEDPAQRCAILAGAVPLFRRQKEEDEGSPVLGWTPLALELLELAPDRRKFLNVVASRFMPNGWSGSLASILEERRSLPKALLSHHDHEVVKWAQEEDKRLADWAARERENERRRDESFE